MSDQKFCIVANRTESARESLIQLEALYGNVKPSHADVIIALGGDGFMLQTQLKFMNSGITGIWYESGDRRVFDE